MKNKIIAVLFLMMIFIIGGASALKSIDPIRAEIANQGLNSKTPSKMESVLQDKIYKKYFWIDIHGLMQKALGRSVVDGSNASVYRMKDGSITGKCSRKSDEIIKQYAENTGILKDSLPKGTELIYIQLPHKNGSDDQLPPGIHCHANENADRLLSEMEALGIETLDIRQCILDEGFDWPTLFYKTDHHWRPQTAMWAAGRISEYLAEMHGFKYDAELYNPDNFKTTTYEKLFLGSLGRRTGTLYAGIDDFELFVPDYETKFDFKSYPGDMVIHREGDFREALIDDGNLKKDYYNINNYAAYTGDSTKTSKTINYKPLNKKKILLVRDSYSCALQPFLSLSQQEVDTIDLRYFKDETVTEHVRKGNYDIVIVTYTPSSFDDKRFTFHEIME